MKKAFSFALTLAIAMCLSACNASPAEKTTASTMQVTTVPATGWQEENEQKVYIWEDGSKVFGWMELEGKRYYFNNDGYLQTGWQNIDGSTYYLREDGSAVTGEAVIDGVTHHFTAKGQNILLVNPWHALPEDYEPELVKLDGSISSKDIYVERSCYDALNAMIEQCNLQCPTACVISGYRTNDYQAGLYNRKVDYYLNQGYSQAEAKLAAAKVVAVPGTSEHQLGLAVDIIDTRSWSLTEVQETLPAQQWLMENSWRFGFVLRYPKDRTNITGIIYEPWHYRYVGVELATELYESDLTLEEHIQQHTKTQP